MMFGKVKTKAVTFALVMAAAVFSPASGSAAYAAEYPTINYTQIEGTMLYVSDETTTNCPTEITAYGKVPYVIRKKLTDEGCKIYLFTNNEIGGNYIGGGDVDLDVSGKFVPGAFRVAVSDRRQIVKIDEPNYIVALSDVDARRNGVVVIHEIGHFVDNHAFGGWAEHAQIYIASSSKEWQTIYANDKAVLGSFSAVADANTRRASECFAETFAYYVLYPDLLKSVSPDAYSYMDKVVASFN